MCVCGALNGGKGAFMNGHASGRKAIKIDPKFEEEEEEKEKKFLRTFKYLQFSKLWIRPNDGKSHTIFIDLPSFERTFRISKSKRNFKNIYIKFTTWRSH